MKRKLLVTAMLCAASSFGTIASAVSVDGATSNPNMVEAGASSALPFGAGRAGLRFKNGNAWSNSINLQAGPVQHTLTKYNNTPINGTNPNANVDGTQNPVYLTLQDVNPVIGWFYNPTLGQIWYEKRAHNTDVVSVRQMANPAIPAAPKFGGLVIAKVPGLDENTNVFFGEWAPRADNPPQNSTDLNMGSANRTVWYVGESPTDSITGLTTATYNVVGVRQHTPGQNDFYTGTVTANFGTQTPSMTGAITRGNDTLDFAGTLINSDGTFRKVNGNNNEEIAGQFFGTGAAAMAGYAKRGTTDVADDIAFGGKKQ